MSKNIDYKLYLVVQRSNLIYENFRSKLIQALDGGVSIVQLREKNILRDEYIQFGKETKAILDEYRIPLIINDDPLVACEVHADGIHLGQQDFAVERARDVLGDGAIIGLSIENITQAQAAKNMPIDYAVISPIFNTVSKTDTAPPLGFEGATKIRKIINKPLLAIGGINQSNLTSVLETGVDGVCIISAIFGALDPKVAATEFKEQIIKYYNTETT